jgi:hypothetical protein
VIVDVVVAVAANDHVNDDVHTHVDERFEFPDALAF